MGFQKPRRHIEHLLARHVIWNTSRPMADPSDHQCIRNAHYVIAAKRARPAVWPAEFVEPIAVYEAINPRFSAGARRDDDHSGCGEQLPPWPARRPRLLIGQQCHDDAPEENLTTGGSRRPV